ncbi:hypothetical protein [Actinokineospora sp. HUAS TT18]|uniref:hypothetical protein n=1 Tax=Actinokineospora sp. HUAS TT18 TaxID=3447451 RepID=UPI003F51BC59
MAHPHPYGRPETQYGNGFTPPQKKTGQVIAAVAGVLTVVGLGFTGFVAPGFLVSEPATEPPTTSTKPRTPGPEEVLRNVADGLDARDTTVLLDLTCELRRPAVDTVIDNAAEVQEATLVGKPKITGNKAVGTLSLITNARRTQVEVIVTRDDDTWCWSDTRSTERTRPSPTSTTARTPTAGGQPVAPEALAAMQKFLDSVNAGDATTAKTLLCSDAIASPQKVDELVGYQPRLRIDAAMDGKSSGSRSVQLYLTGTAKGQRVQGYAANLWVTNYGATWCVHAFRVVVV